MTVKKFILSGLALGAMLMASAPAHAEIPPINLGVLPSFGFRSQTVAIQGVGIGQTRIFKFAHKGGELNLGVVDVKSIFSKKNLHIALYEDTDKDGLFNPSSGHDTLLAGSLAGGQNNTDRKIFAREKIGLYFAEVTANDSSPASYTFIASSTDGNQSNLLAASEVLETLNAGFKLFPLDDKKTSDFYKFTLLAGKQVSITMTPTGGQAQMRVIQDHSFDHAVILDSETVKSSPASDKQVIMGINNPSNEPVTYYLQVSQSVAGQTVATEVKFQP